MIRFFPWQTLPIFFGLGTPTPNRWVAANIALIPGWEQVKAVLRDNVGEFNFRTYVNDQYPMQVCNTVPARVRDELRREP